MKRFTIFNPMALLAMVSILFLAAACDTTDPDVPDALPDLHFRYSVSGAETHDISFTKEGNVADNEYANGAYTAMVDLLSITAQDFNVWLLGMSANTGGVDPGLYPLNQSGSDLMGFTNVTGGTGYVSTSGTVRIIRSELYTEVPGSLAEDYFVDGEFEATLEDSETPPNIINITGSFEGLNIKK